MDQLGKDLKRRREEFGFSIEEISKKTSLSVKNIRQLEEGNLEAFKDELTYVPYYLKNYCNVLNIDYSELRAQLDSSILSYTEAIKLSKVKEMKKLEEKVKNSSIKIQRKKDISTNNISFFVVILLVIAVLIYGTFALFNQKNKTKPTQEVTEQKIVETPKEEKKSEVQVIEKKVEIKKISDIQYEVLIEEPTDFELILNNDSWLSFAGSSKLVLKDEVYKAKTPISVKVDGNDVIVVRLGVLKDNEFKIGSKVIKLNDMFNDANPRTFTFKFSKGA